MAGFQFEAHYALQGAAVDNTTNQGVYQAALDYENGPFRARLRRHRGKSAHGRRGQHAGRLSATIYFNFDYGRGKVYLVYVRSNNNSTTAGSPSGTLNNGGSPLSNVGNSLVAGTDASANTYYDIYQASVDFMLHPKVRIGALYGQIKDDSGTGKNATGYSFGIFWEAFKDVTFYVLGDALDNDPNAGFRPSGSAGLTKTFTSPGRRQRSNDPRVHVGVLYRF